MGSAGKSKRRKYDDLVRDILYGTPEESGSEETAEITDDKLIDAVEYDRSREYEEWDDKASGTHTYDGDGRAQEEFFAENSNFDELIKGMSDEELEAFRYSWTPGHFMMGQQYRGFDAMSAEDQRLTRIYDKILDQATLDKGIVVTRRASAELILGKGHGRISSLEQLKGLRGSLVTSKGSMSTGAARQGLTIGDSGKNVEYVIHIAGGTKGAGMWIGDSRINGWGSQQREFMTNRDSVFAVGRSSYDSRRGVYRVNLYYVGREEHDYGKAGK